MDSIMKEFEHLVIKLEEVKSATDNFTDTKIIGKGGFGNVYEGELSQSRGKTKAAFKRLSRKHGQGDPEFWKEVMMLSRYIHENLISLLGFCDEGGEKILVYEQASNGSLDRHLSSTTLTWSQRIRICHDAAKGLCYLHEDKGNHHRVLHRDIKSSNILLDENWKAKVSDMGLAKVGPTSQFTFLMTDIVGTFGYIDPMYLRMGFLTKESDVYSFGVVLFEVLCGRLCFDNSNARSGNIVHIWKQRYEENKLDEIVFKHDLLQALDQSSLEMFSEIAFQCLQESREKRPKMSNVVEKLEIALKSQELVDLIPKEYEKIVKAVVPPLIYRSIVELKGLLSKGVILNGGKTWFCINDKEEHCIMLSIEDCLIHDDPNTDYRGNYSLDKDSRFVAGCYKAHMMKFTILVITPLFLSPHVIYGVNLVFKYSKIEELKQESFPVMYKLLGETKILMVNVADKREDGWLVAVLYHFTNEGDTSILDLEVIFEDCGLSGYFEIEGIEFQPLGRMEHPVEVVEYEEILKDAVTPLFYRSTEELKLLLIRGILLNGGKTLFCLNEKGQHIEKIFIEACLDADNALFVKRNIDDWVNSRFREGRCYEYAKELKARVRGEYLTPHISYTVNLVFRYSWYYSANSKYILRCKIDGEDETKVLIVYPSIHEREDGWFIVPLYHFTSQHKTADLQFEFEYRYASLLVAGFEFQPSEDKVELPVFAEYQDILEAASQSLVYGSLQELKQILSIGIHLNGYKSWFSLNEKGENCHMISMEDCLIPNQVFAPRYESHSYSRFPAGLYDTEKKRFRTHVKTQLLNPLIRYTVNLVFLAHSFYVDLEYRVKGDTRTSTILSTKKYDYFHLAELYQVTSNGGLVDLKIDFDDHGSNLKIEGILFQPL